MEGKKTIVAVVGALAAFIFYYVHDLMNKRRALKGLPQPPMQNLLLGHLPIADECQSVFPKGAHGQLYPDYIQSRYNLPDVFYVDWRPFGNLFIFISDPEIIARYITTSQNLPKSPAETGFLNALLGKNNLPSIEGLHWRSLRTMFNPGFSAANVMTWSNYIVDKTLEFASILDDKVKTNEHFQFEELATRLTIDIIGKITLDVDMDAQKSIHPITEHFRRRIRLTRDFSAVFPWDDFDLFRPLKLWWNNRQLDAAVNKELDRKIQRRAEEMQNDTVAKKKRTIIDLALDEFEKTKTMDVNADETPSPLATSHRITEPSHLTEMFRDELVTNIKTFFFAGYDTSSSVIANTFYLLHRYPRVQAKLQAELDQFLPSGIENAAATIKADPYIINKLEYLTAVIKESMRIFTPASTIRYINPHAPTTSSSSSSTSSSSTSSHRTIKDIIKDPKTGQDLPLNFPEAAIWPVAYFVHRNPRFFPQPTQFIPERFIVSQTPFPTAELFTPAGREAFRAFERGPRHCIGQELAMTEIKIAIGLTCREFDFVLEYPGESPDPQFPTPVNTLEEFSEESDYGKAFRSGKVPRNRVEGHRCWQRVAGTAKADGGSPGRIYARK